MQIRRVSLKNVRNFVDFDRTFEDPWSERIPDSLLLIGPNGSGKSTLLEVIADLWQTLGYYLGGNELPSLRAFKNFAVAGIEIVGLEDIPIEIFVDRLADMPIATHDGCHRIHVSLEADGGVSYEVLPDRQRWTQRLTENILGKRADLPNMVYLESEIRVLLPVEERFSVQPEPEEYRWLARYEPTTSRKGSLHNYLYNLKVVDETAFQQIVEQVNAFLVGKRLAGFNWRGELLVEIERGGSHSIDDLSSGEKQVLLMIATITRWLRPGGIVLIDEPDLHLHPSLTTAFVSHVRRMVAGKGGQLIIASHAPELWQDFTPSHRVELGSLDEVRR